MSLALLSILPQDVAQQVNGYTIQLSVTQRLANGWKEIHEEMLLMRKRESEMRDLNEATNSRVAWLSVGSLLICVGSAVTQGLYLQKFFKRRKIV